MKLLRVSAGVVLLFGLFNESQGYGPRGHALVGAIADQRLAGKPAVAKVDALLQGLTLAEAALLPDKIKVWDRVHDPATDPDTFHLPREQKLVETDLIAFFKANRGQSLDKGPPSHHWFHYTDVPVGPRAAYSRGKVGRSDFDIVHMIPFCAGVLSGKVTEDNERKITKRVALILLAHFLGDIHQPLHVGAQYFDERGQPVDADAVASALPDEGGNGLTLVLPNLSDHGHAHTLVKLHGFWDSEAVDEAIVVLRQELRVTRGDAGRIGDEEIARRLAAQEPAGWKGTETSVDRLTIAWADEILPIATEAHDRLEFSEVHIIPGHKNVTGHAVERTRSRDCYRDFAAKTTRIQLHKAGWRLAGLLEDLLK
jgi:hypothetical protein